MQRSRWLPQLKSAFMERSGGNRIQVDHSPVPDEKEPDQYAQRY